MIDQTAQDRVLQDSNDTESLSFTIDGTSFLLDASLLPPRNVYTTLSGRSEVYELVMSRCLARILRHSSDARFMDVGAGVGYFTCFAGAVLGKQAPIDAIEANPMFCEAIRRSCTLNGLESVSVHNVVFSDDDGPATVDGNVVHLGTAGAAATTARTVTGEAFCGDLRLHPSIIKMDVHGCEGPVLRGLRPVLETSVDWLLLELHPAHYLEDFSAGTSRREVLALLRSMGFLLHHVAGHLSYLPFGDRLMSGFTYRTLNDEDFDSMFFDRLSLTLILASKGDLSPVLGPSQGDPLLS